MSTESSSNSTNLTPTTTTSTTSEEGDAESKAFIQQLLNSWRQNPTLNPRITFPSFIVPQPLIHKVMNAAELQPYLASRYAVLHNLQQRFKLVRDIDDPQLTVVMDARMEIPSNCKLFLLHPEHLHSDDSLQAWMKDHNIQPGPTVSIAFSYKDFTTSYILDTVLPATVQPPPTSFETIGHVAHLNLKPHHIPYQHIIGEVLLETLPHLETVITKLGDVSGPFRVYDFDVVAGRNDTLVSLTESGMHLKFDLRHVYWCSRLSEERQRLLAMLEPHQVLADAFCGVGALCLMAAAKGCVVWTNDWNPKAIEALGDNAKRNGVSFEKVECRDAYEFLMDLGLWDLLPDHVVMNFPLEAPRFLGALRWWPSGPRKGNAKAPRVHVYTFARADPSTGRSVEAVAVDTIAAQLVPTPNALLHRRKELDDAYDCRVATHVVRDVAPGKVVVCVSFTATPKLVRCMQGDFQ